MACVCILLEDLKDDCRRKNKCHYAFSKIVVIQQTDIFHHYCFGHVTICGHCLGFALDKSNFMASDLFNLIQSNEFLKRFHCLKLLRIDCVPHVIAQGSICTNLQKRTAKPSAVECFRIYIEKKKEKHATMAFECGQNAFLNSIYVSIYSISQVTTIFLRMLADL